VETCWFVSVDLTGLSLNKYATTITIIIIIIIVIVIVIRGLRFCDNWKEGYCV
jgi:hypothetical protein